MGRPLKDLTFEQWVAFVLDHPVEATKKEWYWDPDADWWDGSPADTVQFLTQAFENAAIVFQPYRDDQLNQGLWYIASSACSKHMLALSDTSVLWPVRQRCIDSFQQLYEQCFAKRCTPHLSHLDEPGSGPINMVCYMWWDILPLASQPKDPARKEMDQHILGVILKKPPVSPSISRY